MPGKCAKEQTKNQPDEAVASPRPAGYLLLRSHKPLLLVISSFSDCTFHRVTLLRNYQKTGIYFKGDYSLLVCIGLTLLLTVGLRYRDHEDEFHITTFFRVRFAGGSTA